MKTSEFFVPPPNPDQKIWRYMDFPKYISLLIKGSLYFSRSDLLGDPFEGSYPQNNEKIRNQLADVILADLPKDKIPSDWKDSFLRENSKFKRSMAKTVYINCWHMNDNESAAMWTLYSKDNKGIAIQSTYKTLQSALPESTHVGIVNYIDFSKEYMREENMLIPFVHKRVSYTHEQEIRAIMMKTNVDAFTSGKWPEGQEEGFYISVDLKSLIHNVYIAPYAEKWFQELVVEVNKRLEFGDISVLRSPLEDTPFF